jgi:HNH endonuclease
MDSMNLGIYQAVLDRGVERSGECLLWRGNCNEYGYGRFGYKGGRYAAHRVVFETWNGKLAPKMQVDHLCHNETAKAGLCAGGNGCLHRRCVNPSHLGMVTAGQNTKSSPLTMASQPKKSCKVMGCLREVNSNSFCRSHWKKLGRWGNPLMPDQRFKENRHG